MIKQLLNLVYGFSPLEMYNKTIIGFGFCDMQNYHALAFSSADNSYVDIDNSAYHKNLIQ